MTIRFFGIAHQTWHNDALHEICKDPRLPDILQWLADAGYSVALSRYRGHHTVILQNPALKPGKAFRDTTWYCAAARALLYATANPTI